MTTPLTSNFEQEWRSKEIDDRLAFVYTNKLFTDVTIGVFVGGKEHLFMAHKNILAFYSPVLEETFYGNGSEDSSHTVLTGIDPQGLAYVLKMLYHVPPSPRKDVDRSILLSAYHAAKTLRIHRTESDLKQEILQEILTPSLVTRDDFWKILDLSRTLKLKDITERLLRFAESNGKAVLRAKSLDRASPTTLKAVLDLDMLKTPEKEVLDTIVRWKEGNENLPFVDEFSKELLGCVRFRNLSTLDLCQFVASKSDLISRDDIMSIMMHLGNPASESLPSWCSTKFRRCIMSISNDGLTAPQNDQISSEVPNNSNKLSMKIIRNSNLLAMYLEQKYTDVCFVVGKERKAIKAHRNILAVGSIVFEKMFFSALPDSRHVIDVPAHDPRGFDKMLMYFYDDSDPSYLFKKNDFVSKMCDTVVKYGSMNLKKACFRFYKPVSMNRDTFWRNLELVIKAPSKKNYITQFLDYASKETGDVLNSVDFLDATPDAFSRVLRLDVLSVGEVEILNSVVKWLKHKSSRSKYDVLRLIRFNSITAEEFRHSLTEYLDVLTSDEVLSISSHLDKKESPLPTWCYKGPPRQLSTLLPYE